jgi:hypothetical protein
MSSDWTTIMTALLGKRVEVTLDDDATMKIVGTLVTFDPFGGVEVRQDNGELRNAWPNLHIRELGPDGR